MTEDYIGLVALGVTAIAAAIYFWPHVKAKLAEIKARFTIMG